VLPKMKGAKREGGSVVRYIRSRIVLTESTPHCYLSLSSHKVTGG